MKHSIHIMFGKTSEKVLLELRRYMALYTNENVTSFFTALHYVEKDDGSVCINKVVQKEEEKLTFTSHLHDQWEASFSTEIDIPKAELENTLKTYIRNLWKQRINTDYKGSDNLHLCLYFPLYQEQLWDQVRLFISCAKEQLGNKVDIDIFGFCYDLAEVLDSENKVELAKQIDALRTSTKKVLDDIIALRHKEPTSAWIANFVVIQNQTNKCALELTVESVVSLLGEFAQICIENYDAAFGINVDRKDIQGIGISMLSFDQYYFQEFILQDSFIKILENESIHENEVDITWAAREIDLLLQPWLKIMSDFYRAEVTTRMERGDVLTDIMPAIHPQLKKKFDELNQLLTDQILRNTALSLPQKKGLLSVLLGQDDELFLHGTLINSEQKILTDLERECVNFFVDENNALLSYEETAKETILPPYSVVSGDDQDKKAKLPLDELKELRYKERNYISNIREIEDELVELKQSLTQIDESKKCLIEGGRIIIERGDQREEFHLWHHDDDIVPLQETYTPHPVRAKNIDISDGFTSIKNQGQQGACMSFSMISVFEYFLKQNHEQFPDLSEQFLYYNARKRNNMENEDNGSNSICSVTSLMEDGICAESLWPYEVGSYAKQPSDEAYREAQSRHIKSAVMVKKEIEDIKSALEDGLPIIFCADIFPSFVQGVNGFISLPSQEEESELQNSTENHAHAMVLCGYNDEQQVFKVRNSWGTSFGDKGYCYISYEYIRKYAYWDMVAITEIEVSSLQEKQEESLDNTVEKIEDRTYTIQHSNRPQLNFSESDITIRYALRRNLLDRLKSELKTLNNLDAKLQTYYEEIKLPLRDRNKRDVFYSAALRKRQLDCKEIETQKEQAAKDQQTSLDKFDKTTKRKATAVLSTFTSFMTTFAMIDGLLGKGGKVCDTFKFILGDASSIFTKIVQSLVGNMDGFGGFLTKWLCSGTSILDRFQGLMRLGWILFVILIILYAILFFWIRFNKRKDIIHRYELQNRQFHIELNDLKEQMNTLEARFHLAGEMMTNLFALQNAMQSRHTAMAHFIINLRAWYANTCEAHKQMCAEARAPFVSLIRNDVLSNYFKTQQKSLIQEDNLWQYIENYQPSEEGIVAVQQNIKKELLLKIDKLFENFSVSDYLLTLKDKTNYQYLVHDFSDICDLFDNLNRKSEVFLQYNICEEGRDARRVMFVHTKDCDEKNKLENSLTQAVTDMEIVTISSPYKIIFFQKHELTKDQIEL